MKRERNGRETDPYSLWAAEKPPGEIFVIPAKAGPAPHLMRGIHAL